MSENIRSQDQKEQNGHETQQADSQQADEQHTGPGNQTEGAVDKGQEGHQDTSFSDDEQVQRIKEQLCANCPEQRAAQEAILRIQADADNFRKRISREKEQFCKFATEGVLEDLLPVLDNLDLALQHGQGVEGCADLVKGIEMTRKVFLDILAKHGLELISVEQGEEFDPAWHEAMAEQVREDLPPGSVTQVLQYGYKLRERLLRPAKVMVNKSQ